MQRNYYSHEKLIEVTKHRGYYNTKSVAIAISQNIGLSVSTVTNKIHTGHFSREEMIVIAAYFEMTPKEFCDVFLNGLFNEDSLGHYIAHIDSAYAVLHNEKARPASQKKTKEAERDELLNIIESL